MLVDGGGVKDISASVCGWILCHLQEEMNNISVMSERGSEFREGGKEEGIILT